MLLLGQRQHGLLVLDVQDTVRATVTELGHSTLFCAATVPLIVTDETGYKYKYLDFRFLIKK